MRATQCGKEKGWRTESTLRDKHVVHEDNRIEAAAGNEVVDDPHTSENEEDVADLIEAWEREEEEINRQDASLQLTDPWK